ncbi:hypothetical protein AAFC00_002774 [Neodothiora populina]|uniref:Large ribosomal subunit protein mL67 n=1 Tax=Neodothiora populina TaxID=2781224 RepID=A0ABR3P8H9_9PEZI
MAASAPQKADKLAKRLADHGRHIFFYNHCWTGQTIYSLERSLNNTLLKQLPYAGKKTIPAGIRKDIWRPLLSVTFPTPSQGLQAFRKLREYRKLHELSWAQPTVANNGMLDLENPYVRTETPRPPKKERSRLIMDQRENSVADLAAVLREQAAAGEQKQKTEADRRQAEEARVRDEMASLYEEIRNGGLETLQQSIAAQKALVKDMESKKKARQAGAPSNRQILNEDKTLMHLKRKQRKMIATNQIFENGHARTITRNSTDQGAEPTTSIELDVDPPSIFYKQDLAEWDKPIPKRGRLRNLIAESRVPTWTTQGVVIRWDNPLDAEIAESWPADVEHQDAGLARHVAADPSLEPIFDVEKILRSRKALEEMSLAEQEASGDASQHFMQETKLSDARA